MVMLTDPAILVPSDPNRPSMEFWIQLSKWATDHRLHIASGVFELATTYYAKWGYPQSSDIFPQEVKMECHRAVLSLLQRIAPPSEVQELVSLHPSYSGKEEFGQAIEFDISEAGHNCVDAIACSDAVWASDNSIDAQCLDLCNPAISIEIMHQPRAQLACEVSNELKAAAKKTTLLIFGGKEDQSRLSEIKQLCGFADVRWFESEPDKHIRDIDSKLAGRTSNDTLVVLVTGFISHSESGKVKKGCTNQEAPLVETRYPRGIVASVRSYYLDN